MDEVAKCWDEKAVEWKMLVGQRGDNNRFFNSDPILWDFVGPVEGKTVLDAGCARSTCRYFLHKNLHQ